MLKNKLLLWKKPKKLYVLTNNVLTKFVSKIGFTVPLRFNACLDIYKGLEIPGSKCLDITQENLPPSPRVALKLKIKIYTTARMPFLLLKVLFLL